MRMSSRTYAARLAAARLAADPVAAAPSLVLCSRSKTTRDAITDCARAMKKPGAVSRPGYDILLQRTPFIAKRRNVVNRFGSAAHMQQGEKVENGSSDSTQIFPFYSPTVRSERR